MRSPMFDAVRAPLDALSGMRDWPALADLNALVAGLENPRGAPLRFVPAPQGASAMQYEMQIAATGQIPTRERHWHDFFNACAWLSFPTAKGILSERHAALLEARGAAEARARSVERDVLTLFDESGVVIACADPALADAIRGFRWRELFWERRAACIENLRCYLFGHAQLEKALDPHVGMTARAIIVPVGGVFLAASREAQLATLDHQVARWLDDPANLASTRRLHPFPVLGVPGWFDANADEAFYANTAYFRAGRRPQGGAAEPA